MSSKPRIQLSRNEHGPDQWLGCPDPQRPCDLLLSDPARFFSRDHKRPEHLCEYVGYSLLGDWVERRSRRLTNSVASQWWIENATKWPLDALPVGCRVIEAHVHADQMGGRSISDDDASAIMGMAVFDDWSGAAMIVEQVIDTTRVELFFLVAWKERDLLQLREGDDTWSVGYPSHLKYRIIGNGLISPALSELIDQASQWWTVTMAGFAIRLKRGPEPGSTVYSLAEVEGLLDQYLDDIDDDRDPAWRDFIGTVLHISPRTWARYTVAWRKAGTPTTWKKLLRAAERRKIQRRGNIGIL